MSSAVQPKKYSFKGQQRRASVRLCSSVLISVLVVRKPNKPGPDSRADSGHHETVRSSMSLTGTSMHQYVRSLLHLMKSCCSFLNRRLYWRLESELDTGHAQQTRLDRVGRARLRCQQQAVTLAFHGCLIPPHRTSSAAPSWSTMWRLTWITGRTFKRFLEARH